MQKRVFYKTRVVVTTVVFLFWGTMFGELVRREVFPTGIKQGYKKVLEGVSPETPEKSEKRESLKIYYQGNRQIPIGTVDSILKANIDGTFEVSNRIKISIAEKDHVKMKHLVKAFGLPEVEGEDIVAGIQSKAVIGPDYQLKDLKFRFKSNLFNLSCEGQVETSKLLLSIKQGDTPDGKPIQQEIPFSRNTVINSGFDSLKVPKNLQVGQEFNLQWFDVLNQKERVAKSKVVSKETILWYGKRIPVHIVNTTSGAFRFISWVDERGEVIQYQIFNFLFVRDQPQKLADEKSIETTKKKKESSR